MIIGYLNTGDGGYFSVGCVGFGVEAFVEL